MPFKSETQRRYLFAKKPDVAEKFAAHTTEKQMERLPEHVEKLASGGHVCMHCGGEVGHDGYALEMHDEEREDGKDGHVATNDDGSPEKLHESAFMAALKRREGK
jgi:hypothetical protein